MCALTWHSGNVLFTSFYGFLLRNSISSHCINVETKCTSSLHGCCVVFCFQMFMYVLKCAHVRIYLCMQVHVFVYKYSILCSTCMCSVPQSCPTLYDLCSPPGSSVHAISQARTLEWVTVSFSRGSSQPRDRTGINPCDSCIFKGILYCWATWEVTLCSGSVSVDEV